MSENHGISTQIIKGPLRVSPDYPELVVDDTGREVMLCGLAGDTTRGGAVIAKTFVRLFNDTDLDLTGIESGDDAPAVPETPAVDATPEPVAEPEDPSSAQ